MTSNLRSITLKGLVLASAYYLVSASAEAAFAIATHLPARFGGLFSNNDAACDFLLVGTALSPNLGMLVGQIILTGCVLRGGRSGMVGVIGLTVLGAAYALGQLGEPIARRAFSLATFDAAQATLVAANVVFPTLMAVFGALEWRTRRRASRKLVSQADTPGAYESARAGGPP